MKISVIVPVYNCEAYLPACLDSIVGQTVSDLEIILIDDGSSDSSGAICDNYAEKDARFRVIHQKNQGVSAARNAGLDIALGEFIAFVDSDDTLEPDMYETLVNLAAEHHADIVHCGYKKVHFDGSTKDVLGSGVILVQDGIKACECILAGRHFTGSPCTKLYRKELLHEIRFDQHLKINEDVLLNIQVFLRAKKLVFRDVPKYLYYERAQSATRQTNRLKAKLDCVSAAEEMLDILKGTYAERACAARLYYALIDLYRVYLFEKLGESNAERTQIHNRLCEIAKLCAHIPKRNVLNYWFMRCFPGLYMKVYHIYDRIRTPNIDL